MINKNMFLQGRRNASTLALFTLCVSACTIYIEPYEDDESAQDIPSDTDINTNNPVLDQQARQAEVDVYLETLKANYHVVAETPQTDMLPALWWAASSSEPPPAELLSYLPWQSLDELVPPPGIELPQTDLDLVPELPGPPGTTPILPPNFSAYVMGDTAATSLQDYLDHYQIPGMPAYQDRLYAGLDAPVPNRGVSAVVNHFSGEVEDHTLSLVEVAVSCPAFGPPKEVIGVMIALDRANPGARRQVSEEGLAPRIHVEVIRQVNGKEKAAWDITESGFVNFSYDWGKLSPFVKLPGRTVLGGPVSVSQPGGKQVEHRIDIFQMPWGDWVIAYRGELLGYFPAGLFTMLNKGGCRAHWYSEVYDGTPVNWTFTDMGSGQFASAGLNQAAYIRQPTFRDMNWLEMVPEDKEGNYSKPNEKTCYTRSEWLDIYPLLPVLGKGYFYGGPGGGTSGCK